MRTKRPKMHHLTYRMQDLCNTLTQLSEKTTASDQPNAFADTAITEVEKTHIQEITCVLRQDTNKLLNAKSTLANPTLSFDDRLNLVREHYNAYLELLSERGILQLMSLFNDSKWLTVYLNALTCKYLAKIVLGLFEQIRILSLSTTHHMWADANENSDLIKNYQKVLDALTPLMGRGENSSQQKILQQKRNEVICNQFEPITTELVGLLLGSLSCRNSQLSSPDCVSMYSNTAPDRTVPDVTQLHTDNYWIKGILGDGSSVLTNLRKLLTMCGRNEENAYIVLRDITGTSMDMVSDGSPIHKYKININTFKEKYTEHCLRQCTNAYHNEEVSSEIKRYFKNNEISIKKALHGHSKTLPHTSNKGPLYNEPLSTGTTFDFFSPDSQIGKRKRNSSPAAPHSQIGKRKRNSSPAAPHSQIRKRKRNTIAEKKLPTIAEEEKEFPTFDELCRDALIQPPYKQ